MELLDYYRIRRGEIEAIADPRALFLLGFIANVSGTSPAGLPYEFGWSSQETTSVLEKLVHGQFVEEIWTRNGVAVVTTPAGQELLESLGLVGSRKKRTSPQAEKGIIPSRSQLLLVIGIGTGTLYLMKTHRNLLGKFLWGLAGLGAGLILWPETEPAQELDKPNENPAQMEPSSRYAKMVSEARSAIPVVAQDQRTWLTRK